MKKVLITFLAIFAFIAGHAQITVTLGSALLQAPGTNVHLPVSVQGLNGATGGIGVIGVEFHISYNNTSMVYDTTLNFSALAPSPQWIFAANGTEYSTNWVTPTGEKLNIPDNTILFDIVFQYLGGATELDFDTARCYLIDSAYNIIPGVHYINGQVTPSEGSGESRWNGTGSWNTLANWSNGIPGDSTNAVIVTGSATVLSNAVCRSISISQGSSVIISPDFSLTANSNYTNDGTLSLLSDESGTGSLLVKGSVAGTGVNNFNCYIDLGSANALIVSSPVSGATAAVFGSNVAEKYIESSASWVSMPATDNLERGSGYRISGATPATVHFQGLFTSGDVTRNNLSYTAGIQPGQGLNLLGNPYPSAIQWEQGSWGRTNLDYAVYVWKGYKYVSWNGSIGALKDGIIPAMQGFFVKSNSAGAGLTIPAGSRLHSTQPFSKSSDAVSGMISLQFENTTDPNHFDQAFVHILAGSTSGFDSQYDAWKLNGNNAFPQIYTKAADQSALSINTQPESVTVPVEFQTGSAGSYKITFGNIESFSADQPLFFEDKTLNTMINIRNTGEYVFTSDGTVETGRFLLHFQEVGIDEQHAETLFSVWNTGNIIHITPKAEQWKIDQFEIYSLTGQLVSSVNNLILPAVIHQDHLTNGVYILKISTRDNIYTQKLLVRQTGN